MELHSCSELRSDSRLKLSQNEWEAKLRVAGPPLEVTLSRDKKEEPFRGGCKREGPFEPFREEERKKEKERVPALAARCKFCWNGSLKRG